MTIRPMTAPDREEWLRMLGKLHPELPEVLHEPQIDAYLSGADLGELIPSIVFASEREDGRLGGFIEISVRNYAEGCSGDTPYVESWYVDDDVRGIGVGGALMSAAEAWARQQGFTELASDALLENETSHAAHRAAGFEIVERIVVFRKPLI